MCEDRHTLPARAVGGTRGGYPGFVGFTGITGDRGFAGSRRGRPPAADRAMLVRERLLDRLRARWTAPVTVVSAPAGYGKTTLLAQAMAANEAAPVGVECWLTCEPELTTASSLGAEMCRAVEAPPAADRGEPAAVARAVVDAMWRRSPQPVTLLVDDVHEIRPRSEAAGLLDTVVSSLPANGHVVLAGRGRPPVRLARLEVDGHVVRVDASELAFTDEEVAAFAALRNAPGEAVAACGGWPALAELYATTRSDVVADYVAEEVLAGRPPVARRALALLAGIGSFDEGLARAAVGADVDVAGLLAGLPLVSRTGDAARPGDAEWRLHALWQSLLAGEVTAGEVADARRRVGLALLRRGRVAPAVRALIDAGAWDAFPDAIAEALGAAHPPVARDVLADWLARLPADVRAQPGGRLVEGVLAVGTDLDEARRLLEGCAAEFRRRRHDAGEIACLVQLGQMAWWSEEPDALAEVAARGFELEAEGCAEVVPLACLARGLMFDMANDSRSMLAELDRIRPGSLNDAWSGIASWTRAIGLLELGYTPEALEAAEDAVARAEMLYAPLAETTRLQSLWFQGRTGEVRDALPAVLDRIRGSGYRHHTALVAAQSAAAHALLGQRDVAADHLAQAEAAAVAMRHAPLVDTNLSVAEAALAVAEGDEARAAATLADHVARRPVRQGVAAAPQQRHLALFYVLLPETRPVWDGADLGPVWTVGRGLARAVVAVRAGDVIPPATPALDDPAVVQAHLPPPWIAELALAAIAADRDEGWALLDRTWPVTRPFVADLAQRATGRPGRARAAREALGRLAAPPASRLSLRLLGPVELREDGAAVDAPEWGRQRVRSLLAYLALHRTVSRERLADDLWPDLDAEAQSRNLRVNLTYLLRVLEPHRGRRDASFYVRQHGNSTVSLHPGEWLTVDLWDFDDHCARVADADRQGAPAVALDHALRAVELWRGEPTELASEPWSLAGVEQRRLRYAAVATRAGELLLARGDAERARALAERAFTVDPWLEAAHRLVVAAHLATGDHLAARRALRRYREAIDDLGLDPGEATLMVERLAESLLPAG